MNAGTQAVRTESFLNLYDRALLVLGVRVECCRVQRVWAQERGLGFNSRGMCSYYVCSLRLGVYILPSLF